MLCQAISLAHSLYFNNWQWSIEIQSTGAQIANHKSKICNISVKMACNCDLSAHLWSIRAHQIPKMLFLCIRPTLVLRDRGQKYLYMKYILDSENDRTTTTLTVSSYNFLLCSNFRTWERMDAAETSVCSFPLSISDFL